MMATNAMIPSPYHLRKQNHESTILANQPAVSSFLEVYHLFQFYPKSVITTFVTLRTSSNYRNLFHAEKGASRRRRSHHF